MMNLINRFQNELYPLMFNENELSLIQKDFREVQCQLILLINEANRIRTNRTMKLLPYFHLPLLEKF